MPTKNIIMIHFKKNVLQCVILTVVYNLSVCAKPNPGLQQCKDEMADIFGLNSPLLECVQDAIKKFILLDDSGNLLPYFVNLSGLVRNSLFLPNVIHFYGLFSEKVSKDEILLPSEFCNKFTKDPNKQLKIKHCMEDTSKFGNSQINIMYNAIYLHRQSLSEECEYVHPEYKYGFKYLNHIAEVIKLLKVSPEASSTQTGRKEDAFDKIQNPEEYCMERYKPIED